MTRFLVYAAVVVYEFGKLTSLYFSVFFVQCVIQLQLIQHRDEGKIMIRY